MQGRLLYYETIGERSAKRLIAYLKDDSGTLELIWFKGLTWIEKILNQDDQYIVFGKLSFFMGKPQIVHPELEAVKPQTAGAKNYLDPVYPTTEKLKSKGLGGRQLSKLSANLLNIITEKEIPENLPDGLLQKLRLMPRYEALRQIHFPSSAASYEQSLRRLKFEELFITQLRLAMVRSERHRKSRGFCF